MLMNLQAPAPQDPSTAAQLQQQQLQQALAQPQAQGTPAMPQVQSPWSGASMLVQALTSPQQQQAQGASGASTTPLQSLISWLNQGSNDAGGPQDDDEDSAGGS